MPDPNDPPPVPVSGITVNSAFKTGEGDKAKLWIMIAADTSKQIFIAINPDDKLVKPFPPAELVVLIPPPADKMVGLGLLNAMGGPPSEEEQAAMIAEAVGPEPGEEEEIPEAVAGAAGGPPR